MPRQSWIAASTETVTQAVKTVAQSVQAVVRPTPTRRRDPWYGDDERRAQIGRRRSGGWLEHRPDWLRRRR